MIMRTLNDIPTIPAGERPSEDFILCGGKTSALTDREIRAAWRRAIRRDLTTSEAE